MFEVANQRVQAHQAGLCSHKKSSNPGCQGIKSTSMLSGKATDKLLRLALGRSKCFRCQLTAREHLIDVFLRIKVILQCHVKQNGAEFYKHVEVAQGCLTLSNMVSTSTDCSAAMADDCLSTWASVIMLAAVRS